MHNHRQVLDGAICEIFEKYYLLKFLKQNAIPLAEKLDKRKVNAMAFQMPPSFLYCIKKLIYSLLL